MWVKQFLAYTLLVATSNVLSETKIDDVEKFAKLMSEIEECEDVTCKMENKGLMENNKIREDKLIQIMDEAVANITEMKTMVEMVKAACLNDQYKKLEMFEGCPAMQLEFCFYITGSLNCPKNSCDSAPVCKDTCEKFQEMQELVKKMEKA